MAPWEFILSLFFGEEFREWEYESTHIYFGGSND